MVLGDTTTYVYQLCFVENDSDDTKIIQYFNMHGLVLCIKLNSFLACMLYVWSFSNTTEVPIAMQKN